MNKSKIKTRQIHLIVIIGVILCIYAQSVNYDFTYFDDVTILVNNKPFFTEDFSIEKIFTTDAFTTKESSFYRPLQNISFSFDAYIAGGIKPWMFHLTNVVLFLLIGILLYYLLLKFNITSRFAFFGTLLFATNPLNVWAVVWVPSRGDLLLTLFTVFSFICFINFLKSNKYIDLFIVFISFSLALFSKETAALIPFLFLLYFIYEKGADNIRNIIAKINIKHYILAGLMVCIILLWFYLRYHAINHFNSEFLFKTLISNLQNIPVALSQFFIPYEISPLPKFSIIKILLGTLILIVLLYLAIKKTEIPRWEKFFFLAWFLLFLLPVFFIKLKNIDYLEHRFLLPQIGILLMIIKSIDLYILSSHTLQRAKRAKQPGTSGTYHFIFYIIIFTFGITSFVKSQTLQNPLTVTEATIKHKGNTVISLLNRGGYYIDKELYEKAVRDFAKVIQLDITNEGAMTNLGNINYKFENYENAINFYNASLSLKKDHKVFFYRSLAKTHLKNFESAVLDLDSAIMLNNKSYLLYNNRGFLKMQLELIEEAISDFEESARLSNSTPTLPDSLYTNFLF